MVILRGRRSIWCLWRVTFVAPRIGNDVSYVTRIKHASHSVWQAQYLVQVKCNFSWQVQYLVKVKCHFSWQAQYLVKVKCHFSWQGQYLVKVKCHFSWQAQYLVKVKWHFSWQAQYLVKVKCHFSWQAQYLVKFGKIAGARNVVFFNTKCSSGARKVSSVARRVADWRERSRIMVGSWSDHGRIGRALEMTFQLFSANFCEMLDGHFAWQAQYLVSLEGDICCSSHWKWRFICDEDQACESFCVAGAVLGAGQV